MNVFGLSELCAHKCSCLESESKPQARLAARGAAGAATVSHAMLAEAILSVQQEAPVSYGRHFLWHMGFNSADRQEKVVI